MCGAWLWMCFWKKQIWHSLWHLRSGPLRPCTISDGSRTEKLGVATHTHMHKQRGMGAQLNRVRERGSGGQVCKPHTPSCVTKVTRGMCIGLCWIPLSAPALLSQPTGGKCTIIQEAFQNVFVSLRGDKTPSQTNLYRAISERFFYFSSI